MNNRARVATVLSIAEAVSIGGCSDSMGPTPVDLAQHFDSLYNAAVATGAIGEYFRIQALTDLEIATALGARPHNVDVHTATGVQHWKGVEFAINPQGTQFQSNNILVLYRDANAHTTLVENFALDGSITSATLVGNDSMLAISTDMSGSATLTSSHETCPQLPQLTNPDLIPYEFSSCTSAEFTSSASTEFILHPNGDASLSHLAFSSTVLDGEVFTSGFGDMGSRVAH